MLNNLTGEVSVTWEDKSVTKPLSAGIMQLALISVASVVFTSFVGFLLLGFSITGVVTLTVLSAGGLGASAYFGRDYLIDMFFKDGIQAPQVPDEHHPSTESTSSEKTPDPTEAKA